MLTSDQIIRSILMEQSIAREPSAGIRVHECGCYACDGSPPMRSRMYTCDTCGNKRCPHATDHRHACTGSNEPGQDGSAY